MQTWSQLLAAVRSKLKLDAGGVDDLLPSWQLLVKESISVRRRRARR
jgi:hypothetical protein